MHRLLSHRADSLWLATPPRKMHEPHKHTHTHVWGPRAPRSRRYRSSWDPGTRPGQAPGFGTAAERRPFPVPVPKVTGVTASRRTRRGVRKDAPVCRVCDSVTADRGTPQTWGLPSELVGGLLVPHELGVTLRPGWGWGGRPHTSARQTASSPALSPPTQEPAGRPHPCPWNTPPPCPAARRRRRKPAVSPRTGGAAAGSPRPGTGSWCTPTRR